MTTDPSTESITLLAVASLPEGIDVEGIAERACNAAFKSIADDLTEATGVHTYGDFGPGETFTLERVFALLVRAMAVNNTALAPVEEGEEYGGEHDDCPIDVPHTHPGT